MVYDKLMGEIKKRHKKLLEEYFDTVNVTVSRIERLAYRQGMRDLAGILGIYNTEI